MFKRVTIEKNINCESCSCSEYNIIVYCRRLIEYNYSEIDVNKLNGYIVNIPITIDEIKELRNDLSNLKFNNDELLIKLQKCLNNKEVD